MRAAGNMLNPSDTITCRMAARACASTQVDRHARGRIRIGNGISVFAAVQGIRAIAAIQQVITPAAVQEVRAIAANQHVIIPATVQGVITVAAIQPVSAAVTADDVIFVITGQEVPVPAADNVLETADSISLRMSPGDFTSAQVHRDARVPVLVRPCIGKSIFTSAAFQDVRAALAGNNVVAVIADQRIGILTADNVLNPTDTVPCRVSTGDFASAQVYRDARE